MLLGLLPLTSLLLSQAAIPVEGGETVRWAKKKEANVVTPAGVLFLAEGPAKVVLQLYAGTGLDGGKCDLRLERDAAFVSTTQVAFQNLKGGPPGYPLSAQVGVTVPEGAHKYRVSGPGIALEARKVAKLPPKAKPAAAEVAMSAAATSSVAASTSAERSPTAAVAEPPASSASTPAIEGAQKPASPVASSTHESAASTAESSPQDRKPAGDREAEQAIAAHEKTQMAVGAEVGASQERASSPQSDSGRRGMRVAVYDLQLEGIEKNIGTVATNSLLAEIRKLQGISAIGMAEIRDMLALETMKDQLGCDDVTCLAEIGGALGVDELITGTLSRVGDGNAVAIRRIDQLGAKVVGAYNQRLKPGQGEEFLLAIGPAVEELYPSTPLRSGAKRGVPEQAVMRLHPPPLPRWLFWTTSGVAASLGALGSGAYYLAKSKTDDHNEYAKRGVPPNEPIDGSVLADKRAEADTWRNASYGLLIGAGVAALAAGLESLFTDWDAVASTSTSP